MNETPTHTENIPQEYIDEERYPRLLERVKAIVIDKLVYPKSI